MLCSVTGGARLTQFQFPTGPMATSTEGKRIFPLLYVQTGDVSKDKLAFIHILEKLKVNQVSFLLIITQVYSVDAEKNRMG